MEDLKTLTVKYLRGLARKHLGKGQSKLKTREELIAAVREFLPGKRIGAPAPTSAVSKGEAAPGDQAAEANATPALGTPVLASPVATLPPIPSGAPIITPVLTPRVDLEPVKAKAAERTPTPQRTHVEPAIQHDAEPIVEGFFVARILGVEEARRHRMTNDANRHVTETRSKLLYDENLGELPPAYQDDSAVALPKDPTTVFFFWDFNTAAVRAAFEGLKSPVAVLRIFDGEVLVRELDVNLDSKSFYVQGLTPGRRYRLEAHAVGRDGKSRRVGDSTSLVAVPAEGPSPETRVRFLKAPWPLPLTRMVESIRAGRAQVRESPGPATYLEMDEVEERVNSETHLRRRRPQGEQSDGEPGGGEAPRGGKARQRRLGASERHLGASGNWPSGRK